MESGWDDSWRAKLGAWIERPPVQRAITLVISLNAVTLGLETSPTVMAAAGPWIELLDTLFLSIFVVEITARLAAHGLRFFRDPWSMFDFVVVGVALLPHSGPFAVLRALRVLRVLRLVSVSPQLRKVVGALLGAIPGLSSIIVILLLLFYVFAVMATSLFAARFPEWFGSVGESMYSLFQVMTLESWSMGIVRPVMEVYPYAWVFFIAFIVIATFTMLNLFIAIIVNALQSEHAADQEKTLATVTRSADEIAQALHEEIQAMRGEIQGLRSQIERWGRDAEGRTAKERTS